MTSQVWKEEKQRTMDLWDPSTKMHSINLFGWAVITDEHYGFAFCLQAFVFPPIATFLAN
jgi:hypothetical protein